MELEVRSYLARMLPAYHVTGGHLIDREGLVSPQLDVIIADNSGLPTLFKTQDGTEYVPAESALAIGEVKSTYKHSDHPYEQFSEVLKAIHTTMYRPLIDNTAYGFSKVGEMPKDALLRDAVRNNGHRCFNHLYSFLFFVDSGNFATKKLENFVSRTPLRFLPDVMILLNGGVLCYAKESEDALDIMLYPAEGSWREEGYSWQYVPSRDGLPAIALARLYASLVEHLSGSFVAKAEVSDYVSAFSLFDRRGIQSVTDYAPPYKVDFVNSPSMAWRFKKTHYPRIPSPDEIVATIPSNLRCRVLRSNQIAEAHHWKEISPGMEVIVGADDTVLLFEDEKDIELAISKVTGGNNAG